LLPCAPVEPGQTEPRPEEPSDAPLRAGGAARQGSPASVAPAQARASDGGASGGSGGVVAVLSRVFSALLPRTRTSLFRALVDDRLLAAATLLLFVTACVPLFLTPFLPFPDLPLNTASAELMWDVMMGKEPASTYHRVNWAPVPYWVGYALACLFGRLFGPLIAAKVLTALVIALLPLSTMRLLLSLRRDPRIGLWAFALVWQQNLYAGWLAFVLGVALVSIVLAWIIEAETPLDGLRIAPYSALVALTHIQATWLLGLCGGLLCLTTGPILRRVLVHLAAGAGAAAMVLLWLFGQLSQKSGAAAAFSFTWHTPAYRLSKAFYYVLDNFVQPDAERVAAIAFVVLVLGPLALTQLPQRPFAARRSPLVLIFAAGILYTLLWWEVGGPIWHWYTYPRYAAVVALWLMLVPAPRTGLWSTLALLPGILSSLALNWMVAKQFWNFGQRTRPFLEVIAAVPPRASVLPFVFDEGDPDPDLRLAPYKGMYAYIAAIGHGYTPYLWNIPSHPFSNTQVSLPAPGWSGAFSMDEHGRHYDYLLVQGFQHADPVKRARSSLGFGAQMVLERERWRLYRVTKPKP
jgi:hypothetical protein